MKVLIACEESQEVCKAFRALGHEAYSCDIQEPSGGHLSGDAHGREFSKSVQTKAAEGKKTRRLFENARGGDLGEALWRCHKNSRK